MTHIPNYRDRRILTFPAVHPCEGISSVTLLASLITLSQNICNFQHESFTTQRRNARETMRQIGVLLIFLHEIRERGLVIPDSILLCFSELHFTFQKIHFLIQDCTLEGARLFMLTKSQYVATQFRSLIRAMATALDVLPLQSFEVCSEVKELVELVAKQARKAKFEIDPKDEIASKRVHSILRQFERGTEPDVSSMQGIMNYLEIKTWKDCNKEIKFLEDEISFRCCDCDEREVPLLSSLVGFLCYCRAVIFETLDNQSEARFSTEMMITYVNPEDFRCPISLELMTEPVTVSTGQTYDRASIQKWLKAGNMICPKTGEKLKNTELVPNTTLKRLIQQFCADNDISLAKSCNRNRDITRTIVPGSSAAAHAMQFLSWFLTRRLVFGTQEQKNKAAYEIRVLARSSIFNRTCLVEVGTVPPLLGLLTTNDKSTQENAISSLLKLSKHASGSQSIMDSGGLEPILLVLKKGLSLEARQIAAATIFYLSSVKEYRKLIGENPVAIPGLVELVKEGTTCGKKNAVVAIFGLLLLPRNHRRVLEAALAENVVDGAHAILQASALSLIIGMLRSATSRAGKEHSASILLSLCVNVGVEVVAVLAKDPSLMPSLYSLLTDGTSHAAKKARFLIKVLQDFNETTISGLKGSSIPQERSLHVW
ncbi:U-box domain-containing protein 19-like isoform X2 [Gastrolobium bilobum]|uniref:U-box domain-containing protein 19-like isoform X2 n=1 Tax=Gastrolobium bilobum TaxID=150636 RepID=UPI002AAF5697|nr:U-box domain-containing protein 19-like isoform X2 [Gastrolobium bilobum]